MTRTRRRLVSLAAMFCALAIVCGGLAGCSDKVADRSHGSPQEDTPRSSRTRSTEDGRFRVTYTPRPDPIPRGVPFGLDVTVEPAAGTQAAGALDIEVSANSPAVDVMQDKPSIERRGGAQFAVEGMQFPEPGLWLLHVVVHDGAGVSRVAFYISLK